MIDVARIDRHIEVLRNEIAYLESRAESWAQRKAASFREMQKDFLDIRRERQMTGIGGKRIDG